MDGVQKKDKLWSIDFIKAGLAQFLTACSFHILIPILPLYLSEVLHIPHSKIGVVLSSYALALLFIRPFAGYIVDVFPRKMIYLIGLFAFVSVFAGYWVITSIGLFIIFRFIHGITWGITSVSANTMAIDIIPSSRRAEGIGYFGVSMNIAMAIAPYFAITIYNHPDFGFSSIVGVSVLFGILAFITVLTIRSPKITPEYGPQRKALKQPFSFDRFILVSALPLLGNQILLTFGWGTLAAYAILYGQELGIENSGYFFVFLAIGIMTSRVLSGKLVDKGYLHQIILLAMSLVAFSFFCFAYFSTMWSFFLSALGMGLSFGALLPALQTLYVNMATAERRGTANATYLTGFDLGIGVGMLLGARIADKYTFETMYYIPVVLTLIAIVVYRFISMPIYEKRKIS